MWPLVLMGPPPSSGPHPCGRQGIWAPGKVRGSQPRAGLQTLLRSSDGGGGGVCPPPRPDLPQWGLQAAFLPGPEVLVKGWSAGAAGDAGDAGDVCPLLSK